MNPETEKDERVDTAASDEAPREDEVRDEAATGDEPVEETLESLRAERDEARDLLARARADYQNLKRRNSTDFEAVIRRAMQPLLESLCLVDDYLEMALASPTTTDEAATLAQGVEMTRAQLLRALEDADVHPIPEDGTFDPELHQAMARVEDDTVEAGSIVRTTRRGYRWRQGVLRHAQVHVAGPAEEPAQAEAADAPMEDAAPEDEAPAS